MKRVLPALLIFFLFALPVRGGEIGSLSHLFALGKGLVDSDGDGLVDALSFRVVIPDRPTAREAAAAADIAGRANLESLAADFDLVETESRLNAAGSGSVILVGSRLAAVADILRGDPTLASLGPRRGAVTVFRRRGLQGLAVIAGSDEVLLLTARAFFLRWPYFWDIWGRENGATYLSLESDLGRFFDAAGIARPDVRIRRADYEFPSRETPHQPLKRLSFDPGELRSLEIDLTFAGREAAEQAGRLLSDLARARSRGLRTETLSYPGCALLDLHLHGGGGNLDVALPRPGYPKRMLTPGYKASARPEAKGKEFDLLSLLTTKAALSDTDQDGLADLVETSVIVPPDQAWASLSDLTTRLVMSSAGSSFPLVYLDKEVEEPKALPAPILVGDNSLSRELQKTGRLKPGPLGPGLARAEVVPAAFHKSSALVLTGADNAGLEALLGYLGRTYPYLAAYGPGNPRLDDVVSEMEKLTAGEYGAAEAFFHLELERLATELKGQKLESLRAEVILPRDNPAWVKEEEGSIRKALGPAELEFRAATTRSGRTVFEKSHDFSWEADDALALLEKKLKDLGRTPEHLTVEAGLSESPAVRRRLETRYQEAAARLGIRKVDVSVRSAYKQGFFWLMEEVLPRLKDNPPARLVIHWAVEKDDFSRMKRFYSEPIRWLQELYPVDELLARELGIPLDRVEFESQSAEGPVYNVQAFDSEGTLTLERSFSPRLRELTYLRPLPEWGTVRVSTGWLKATADGAEIVDEPIQSDLERFWEFYQQEVLQPVYETILEKTGNAPAFSKQPFFKKLTVELWASEPDYRLGLDEERVSSLEAMHDELYFDTLDFLRGITDLDQAEEPAPEDTSRFSAPGNVLPLIHPSTEGEPPRVKVAFEEDRAAAPQLEVHWKEAGHTELSRRVVFPSLKLQSLSAPALVYDARAGRIENLTVALELDKEESYKRLIDILQAVRAQEARGMTAQAVRFPGLGSLTLRLKFRDLEKSEDLPVLPPLAAAPTGPARPDAGPVVPEGILSPEMVWESVHKLQASGRIEAYTAGTSYEGRAIPVLEAHTPSARYVSVPRLITFKPTLYVSGRQHANEVSSTSYILLLAERLARDPAYAGYIRKINFVLHPLENPDGASLAFDLQRITPEHSLHAGRYSALGLEIGYQTESAKPILPEAKVRRDINAEWLPDIYLNLHGYPSHEWVQAFSGYSPYLFREYWIPKGWFAYYRAVTDPFFRPWREAAQALEETVIREMQSQADLRASNKTFYDRYFRWATRWQPHLDPLELHDGLNIILNRRSSQEVKPRGRTRTTYVEETPELMDETARGDWLRFLTEQGLTYLQAHIKYLAATQFDILRLEEEVSNRVRIQFFRSRPGRPAGAETDRSEDR
jgi:hypothetical protein